MRNMRTVLLPVFVLLANIEIAQTMPDIPTVDVDHSYGTECGFTHLVPAYCDSIEGFIKRKEATSADLRLTFLSAPKALPLLKNASTANSVWRW